MWCRQRESVLTGPSYRKIKSATQKLVELLVLEALTLPLPRTFQSRCQDGAGSCKNVYYVQLIMYGGGTRDITSYWFFQALLILG